MVTSTQKSIFLSGNKNDKKESGCALRIHFLFDVPF